MRILVVNPGSTGLKADDPEYMMIRPDVNQISMNSARAMPAQR